MLGSITPLGERGRGSMWRVTVTAYVAGSVLAAAVLGASLGWVGGWTLPGADATPRLAALASILAVGLALDLGAFGARLPSVRRQVDEGWRTRYRGWVWGLGYGAQLGVGVVTIVTTSVVYVTWAAALVSGGLVAGAAIGSAFGLARALPILTVAGVRRPDQLLRVDASLSRLALPARRATYAACVALATTALLEVARW
jgi:hypothetical protein